MRATVTRRGLLSSGLAGFGLGALGCTRASAPELEVPTQPVDEDGPDFSALSGFCAGLEPVDAKEYAHRIERALAAMRAAKLDALVLEPGPDQTYFCGMRLWPGERPELLCVTMEREPFLVVSAYEVETLAEHMGPFAVELRPRMPDEMPWEVAAAGLADSLGAGARVGIGGSARLFVLDGLRAAAPSWTWESGTPIVEGCRMVKTPTELALLRRANEATQAAIEASIVHLREGQSEREFAAIITAAQQAAGLDSTWALVQFGESAAEPHGEPGPRTLREGDLILIDTGGFLHGYASDISRTVALGSIDDRRRRAWDTVLAAQSRALAAMRPGVACAEIDAVARRCIDESGFGTGYSVFRHDLGHGIGTQVHEQPYLAKRSAHVLAAGMTMSNEPGIYVAGEFGVRIEDIVLVIEDGAEVLGRRAVDLQHPFG